MALYRRFAVYLYQYQGAKKGAGAGFGMIELRDGRIRMQLTGRGSAAQGNLEVYGLLDAPADMAGVRLGSMQAGRFVLEAGEDIGEGKLFSDLRGIVLTARPGTERAVAALWNGTFDAGRFVQWKAPEKPSEAETQQPFRELFSAEEAEESSGCICSEESRAALCEERRTELYEERGTELCEERRSELCEKSGVELSAEKLPSDTQAEESPMVFQENVSADISFGEKRDEVCAEDMPVETFGEEENSNLIAESVPANTSYNPLLREGRNKTLMNYIPAESPSHLDFVSAALDLVEFGEPLEIEAVKPRPTEPVRESVLWQQLCKQYPKMNIPMQQGPLSCLRIRPCDINRLPKTNWKYGCSHFLARHYNRYRCLILGRTQHENGWEYFMGVPGGSTQQERKEAADAGFDHYIAVEKGHGQWPEGFWLVQLQWME